MGEDDIRDVLANARSRTLICVGDLLLDRFVDGHADKVSREAPVLSFSARSTRIMPGGVGNVARNLSSLGAQSILISVVGDDAEADALEELFGQTPSISLLMERAGDYLTPTKTRYVASGHQTFSMDRNPLGGLAKEAAARMLFRFDAAMSGADGVILSDYGRGVLTPEVIRHVIDRARAAQIPVFVDPRGKGYHRYQGATLIKPNALELQEETGIRVNDDASAEAALIHLAGVLDQTSTTMVTRGGSGISVRDASGAIHHVRCLPRQVFDVSGAGDTTLAGLAIGFLHGRSFLEAAAFANRVAGIAVSKAGTATVSPEEVLADLAHEQGSGRAEIVSLLQAGKQTRQWKQQGLVVGVTNGCFDILHTGHLQSLENARGRCDRLIVALNDDASVSALKGPSRPVNPLADRQALLAGLRCVDLVTSFSQTSADEVLRTIHPDRYFKGNDYSLDTLPEAETAASLGIECVFLPLRPGRSTTAIIARSQDDGKGG